VDRNAGGAERGDGSDGQECGCDVALAGEEDPRRGDAGQRQGARGRGRKGKGGGHADAGREGGGQKDEREGAGS